jgi:hypothetical protein
MGGRFVIEKSYPNNYNGSNDMDIASLNFDTEQKVIEYLKIQDVTGV